MSSVTEDRLSKAYRLIEADELGAARAILQPLLADEPNNVDAWWLMAHAVTDPTEARAALDNVVRLDPNYPGAVELSQSLDEVLVMPPPPEVVAPPPAEDFEPAPLPSFITDTQVPAPATTVDMDSTDLPDFDDEAPTGRRRSLLPAIIAAIIVVLLVIVVAVLLLPRGNGPAGVSTVVPPTAGQVIGAAPSPTSTQEIIAPPITEEATVAATEVSTQEVGMVPTNTVEPTTEPPTATLELPTVTPEPPTATTAPTELPTATQEIATLVPTPESTGDLGMMLVTEQAVAAVPTTAATPEITPPVDVTLTPVVGDFQALTVSLAGFTLPANAVGTAQTDLGNSLLVTVCTRPGEQVRHDLPLIMDSISKQLQSLPAGTDAVGARMYDCQANRVLLIILATTQDAAQYVAGTLDEAHYQALWKPH